MADILQIRASQETQQKFKNKVKELGLSQAAALDTMMLALDMQKGSEVLPSQKELIEQFQNYANAMCNMYLTSLETSANQKSVAVEMVQGKLNEKDNKIKELTEEIESLKYCKEENTLLFSKNENLESSLKDVNSQLDTLKTINDSLLAQLPDKEDLKAKLEEAQNKNIKLQNEASMMQEKISTYLEKIGIIEKQIKALEAEASDYKSQITTLEISKSKLEARLEAQLEASLSAQEKLEKYAEENRCLTKEVATLNERILVKDKQIEQLSQEDSANS